MSGAPREQSEPGPFLPAVPEGTAERDAAAVVMRLLEAAERIRAILCARLADCELNEVRYASLTAIDEAAPDGCSQTDLAAALGQSESSVSTLVDRMRVSGLLYRLRSKTDRRRHVLMLTARGRELLSRARDVQTVPYSQIVNGLDAPQVRMLAELLSSLIAALSNLPSTDLSGGAAEVPEADDVCRPKPTAA